MPSFLLSCLLAALALAGTAGPQSKAPQDPSATFQASADVTIVEIPVHVSSRDARPLRGLTKADFELYDEGKLVTGWDLDVIDLEDFSRKVLTPDVQLPPAAQRHFFFLFDLTFAQPLNVVKARQAAIGFVLNSMKNGDLGAVATVDVERGVKLVLSFTADRDQLAAALSSLSLPTGLSPTADPLNLTIVDPSSMSSFLGGQTATGGRAAMADAEAADLLSALAKMSEKTFDSYSQGRVQAMAKEMEALARTLNSIRGRKTVVYFSEGFDSKLLSGVTGEMSGRTEADQVISGEHWKIDNESRFGRSELRMVLDEMFQVFKKSDCALYSVDISGLAGQASSSVEGATSSDRSSSTARLGSRGRGRDSLYLLAAETGGQLFDNSNDLGEHLEKLQEQTALVYLLSYSPSQLKEPGKYHDLKVKVKRSGTQVSFRAGYYEPKPWSKLTAMERRLMAAEQIAYGLPRTDFPARALAPAFLTPGRDRARVPLVLEIPGDALVKAATGDKLTLEIFAYATDQSLKVKGYVAQSVELDLKQVRAQLERSGLKFYGEISVPPGMYWLKVLVRVAETGRSGLMIVPLTVPPRESRHLFAVGPLFHEAPGKWLMVKAPPRPGAASPGPYPFVSRGESFIPAAEPALDRPGEAALSVFVYNAPDGADLAVRGDVRSRTGTSLGPAAITKVATSRNGDGPLDVLCSFRPEKLEKGSYALRIGVVDRNTGNAGETIGFFEVR
jgi:VWFA-related protein